MCRKKGANVCFMTTPLLSSGMVIYQGSLGNYKLVTCLNLKYSLRDTSSAQNAYLGLLCKKSLSIWFKEIDYTF